MVDELLPSVVSIATSQTVERQTSQLPELPECHPFNDMFDDFFGNQMPKRENLTGLGSGFIINDEGYVVTNNHVISGADQITVIFNNGIDEVSAELVGTDPKTDIAVLKIDPSSISIQSVNWGDSDISRVGDIVLAIGNPLGLGGTVTSGIISSINRDIGGGPYVDFIQTDAPINRGNSGGPLFNLDGEVIGINTAIVSQTGGSIGLGFAIPANSAKKIVQQLKDFGKTKRGWLGVQIQPVTKDFAESLGLPDQKGAFISNVNPNGPSKTAGLEPGDVILKFNNIEIKKMPDLPRVVAESDVGSTAILEVWRKNKKINIEVILGELPGEVVTERKITSNVERNLKIESLGITIEDHESGVKVISIDDIDSSLQNGDIITEVNREVINNMNSFEELVNSLEKTGRSSLLLKIIRDDEQNWVTIKFKNN